MTDPARFSLCTRKYPRPAARPATPVPEAEQPAARCTTHCPHKRCHHLPIRPEEAPQLRGNTL